MMGAAVRRAAAEPAAVAPADTEETSGVCVGCTTCCYSEQLLTRLGGTEEAGPAAAHLEAESFQPSETDQVQGLWG